MNATKNQKTNGKMVDLKQIIVKVAAKPEGLREEYAWYYLNETYLADNDAAKARWAGQILKITGK
jgi:hypothetical protein